MNTLLFEQKCQFILCTNCLTAKLSPNCPKPERPHRESVGKEAVHSGLAAAAAKYAHLPVSIYCYGFLHFHNHLSQ